MIRTIASTPTIEATPIGTFLRYTKKPNTIAIRMNNTEIMATDAGVADLAISSTPLSSYTAPNVDATIEAKAATTRISVRYEKIMNSCFARLLMLAEMISPIDWPLLRTDAKSAPKSCTPPKKIPPMRIQRVTGSQPKIAAPIGPVIGPAPAIDEK